MRVPLILQAQIELLKRLGTALLHHTVLQRKDLVAEQLGRLFIPHRQLAMRQHREIRLQVASAFIQGPGKDQQLHAAGIVLQGHIGHQGIVPGGLGLYRGDHPRDDHLLLVPVPLRSVLPREIRQDGPDGLRPTGAGGGAELVHGVAGEIETSDLLLHEHPLPLGVFGDVGHGDLGDGDGLPSPSAEEVELPLQALLVGLSHRSGHLVADLHELGAAGAGGVESSGADQALQHPAVQVVVIHPGTEIGKGGKGPVLLPLGQQARGKAPAHPFQRRQAEADVLPRDGKFRFRLVHIRRQKGDAHILALGNILRHLLLGVQHRGQKGRHILPGVVVFEPRGLIGHNGVAHRVGLVEGVVGEVVDLVVDGLARLYVDAVAHTAGNASLGISPQECLPLPLHILGLLLAHGPADHIRLSQRVTAQLAEDFDDLLLVDDTAVGDGENGLERRVLVGDQLGVMLAGDEPGDGVHGAGAVKGDDSGDVLNAPGLESHAHPRHPRRLHLEHPRGLSLGEHTKHVRVVHGDALNIKGRVTATHHLDGVVQNGDVAQTQKVHF